ncbi:EPHX3 hydrolase, partial [Podargus strigoides]|nr:EPHX3 hydrolase [Podargus strigoides]
MLLSLCTLLLAPTRLLLASGRLVARLGVAVAAVAAGVAYGLWGAGDSGLRLHYVTRGPPTAPLMLLLHGFPQNWWVTSPPSWPPPPWWHRRGDAIAALAPARFCWRFLLQAFGARYRVVALDLRGYGASEKPPDRDSYRLEVLLGDIREVIESLGTPPGQGEGSAASPKCVLVGHDWGGLLAWEVAASHPALVEKLVVMDGPQRAGMEDFIIRHPSQLLRSSYVFLFQLPWLPEFLLSLADFQLVKTILTGPWMGIRNPARRLTEQELDAYIYGLAQPGGLSPPIHYYRNLFRWVGRSKPPPLPTLVLWGTHDAFLDPRLAPHLLRCLRPSARLRLLPGASHWLPEDQPRLLIRMMDEFLGGDH